jgi:hypothetical protein
MDETAIVPQAKETNFVVWSAARRVESQISHQMVASSLSLILARSSKAVIYSSFILLDKLPPPVAVAPASSAAHFVHGLEGGEHVNPCTRDDLPPLQRTPAAEAAGVQCGRQ